MSMRSWRPHGWRACSVSRWPAKFRDDGTHEHGARVGRSAEVIARGLGLGETPAVLIGLAALLHDVGKLAIPDATLLKPGGLNAAECEQIKTETTAGAAIRGASTSGRLRLAGQIALSHHERWDARAVSRRLGDRGDPHRRAHRGRRRRV